MREPIGYRPPRRSELADCALIWYSAVDDYMARLNRPLPPPYLDPLLALLEHLLVTDPERFLVAVRPAPREPRPAGRSACWASGLPFSASTSGS